MNQDLPRRQQQLHDLLFGKGDVPIGALYDAMADRLSCDTQDQQRWLGPYISNLNKNLAERGLRVEPGALKNTYRLVVLTT